MIDRCECYNITFSEMLVRAEADGITRFPLLRHKYRICNKCSRCRPFVIEALASGRVEFEGEYKPKKKHDRKNKV